MLCAHLGMTCLHYLPKILVGIYMSWHKTNFWIKCGGSRAPRHFLLFLKLWNQIIGLGKQAASCAPAAAQLWQSEKCGHQQIINCVARNKLMIGWCAPGGGERGPAWRNAGSSPRWAQLLSVKAEVSTVPDAWLYGLCIVLYWDKL